MKLQFFAFVVFLVSGFPLDYASKVDDRRLATCRNEGQTCSSKLRKQCCTGSNCEIPALSAVGTCKANCLASGDPCTDGPSSIRCCIGACRFTVPNTPGTCTNAF